MSTASKRKFTWALWAVPAVIVLAGVGGLGAKMMAPPPADLDLAREKTSENGLFVASIQPGGESIAINEIHSWTTGVTLAEGTPVEVAAITVDGGMPQHGHGLPTKPQVTRELGDGRYEVEGMKFNMPGWWVVNIHVDTPEGADKASFNLTL